MKRKTNIDTVALASSEIGNKPPQAPEVEEAVIGALMVYEECVYKATEVLTEKSFYDPKLRLVYQAIVTLFHGRTPVDITTVTERLRENGVLEEVGGLSKLAFLTEKVGSAANFDYYTKIL